MRPLLAVILATTLAVSGQQMPQAGSEQVFVTAIDVVADVRDAKGNLPAGLKPDDFVVVEDGVERTEGVFRFRTPLDLPPTATAIVLVIEETTTGVWGSTRVDIPAAATPAS